MAAKMKRPLASKPVPKVEPPEKKDDAEDERPWWARPDDELVKDRAGRIKEWYGSTKVEVDEEDRDQLIEEAYRRDPRVQNLLDMVIEKEDGISVRGEYLVIPLYSSKKGKNVARVLGLKTVRRIRLDEYGWSVWKLMDGNRDVRTIGRLLSDRFGEEVEPLYPRLSKFLAYLQNLKLIRITERKKG